MRQGFFIHILNCNSEKVDQHSWNSSYYEKKDSYVEIGFSFRIDTEQYKESYSGAYEKSWHHGSQGNQLV